MLRIAIGSDRAGLSLKNTLARDLRTSDQVTLITDVGAGNDPRPYPEIGCAAALLVARGHVDRAVLVCHTGAGMAIAANKVRGVRAVVGHDPLTVEHAVTANNAQVLALGQGVIETALARRLLGLWLGCRFDPSSSAAVKVALLDEFETHHLIGSAHAH
ncbi:RpiB/LacA/LacB family sugar-phosphate isomerase [Streptomyces sp. NPDC001691]|uniref:RpiB/LacA/LacB family sugar-phosphate isomerase n=1 Tax=Streptomyces sp. NPDC001691 TaxID=3364600 RepID=UPI0036CC8974